MPVVPEHVLRRYLRGGCHDLAREMHRMSGWPLHALRDAVGAIHHSFIADPVTGIAWDIRGARPIDAIPDGSCVPDGSITDLDIVELDTLTGEPDIFALDEAAEALRRFLAPAGFPLASPATIPLEARQWRADEACAQLYGAGSCHVFAMALRDACAGAGRFLGFRVVFDAEEVAWESDADADVCIHAVVHVLAVFEAPDGLLAGDVFGFRPLEEAVAEVIERYHVGEVFHEDFRSLDEMAFLIDAGDEVERPLHAVSLQDLEEARRAVQVLDLAATPAGPEP